MTVDKDSKITYVDFKSINQDRKKPTLTGTFHTNPVIDKLFKLMHTKLSVNFSNKDKYKSYSEFKPEDLV